MLKAPSLLGLCALLACAAPARALIFYSTADVEKNTTAPTGTLANSGWDLLGNWGPFTGTPIDAHRFIAATHVGGVVGQTFTFRGANYTTVSRTVDAPSDLTIWEVAETFPAFATLFDGASENNSDAIIFGRGATRGAEVRVGGVLKGWKWGAWDMRLRWGQNRIVGSTTHEGQPSGDLPYLLKANFDSTGGDDEAHLAVGDSSGAIFILHGGAWKLAGINYSVDGSYNTTNAGEGFNAAIFDDGGLYQGAENNWQLTPDLPIAQPGALYATRVKARLAWIQGVLASPLTIVPTLFACDSIDGTYAPAEGATVNLAAKTIRIPATGSARFFRVRASAALTISNTSLDGSTLVFEYR
jgi:hypothetical protein